MDLEVHNNKLSFKVSKWAAWSPAFKERLDWENWAKSEDPTDPLFQAENCTPPVTFLPIGMRKKLSDLCKLVLYLSHQILEGRNDVRIVMASRYGECELTLELLEAVGRGEALSPMVFSRSVMNSSLGLFSIFSKNYKPSTCVSAMRNTFNAGLFESLTQLHGYDEPILFLYVEEKVLEVFKDYAEQPKVSIGMGFLLEKGSRVFEGKHDCWEFLRQAII